MALAQTMSVPTPEPAKPAVPAVIRGVMTDDIKTLQEVGANACLLWGPPAKSETYDALNKAGQFVFLNGFAGPKKEFFEFEGKKRSKMKVPFCFAGEWGQWWVQHIADGAAKRPPGICNVTTDEAAWNNGHIAYTFGIPQPVGTKFYCDCDVCRKAVGQLPEITASRFLADTPEARKFVNYRYKTTADTFRQAIEQARKADPNFMSYCTLNLREVLALERYPTGIALDMMPQVDILLATTFQASVDRRGEESRFIQPMVVKHLLAARPKAGAVVALAATVYDYREKFDWTEAYYWRKQVEDLLPEKVLTAVRKDMEPYKLRDDEVILPALSSIAQGARGVMFFGEDNKAAVKKLFALLKTIEEPLAGSSVPGEVVVLCSRQSEDEWMLSHAPKATAREDLSDAMMQLGCWAQPADRIAWEYNRTQEASKGSTWTSAVMSSLIQAGVSFRLQYVENLKAEDLASAKVLVFPFLTHISDESAEIIRKVVPKAKVIWFGEGGEHDSAGKKRETEFLMDLPGGVRNTDGLRYLLTRASNPAGGPGGPTWVQWQPDDMPSIDATYASPLVERPWLQLADGGRMMFVINWSEKSVDAKVKLPSDSPAMVLDTSGTATGFDPSKPVQVPARDAMIIIQKGAKK